MTHSLNEDRQKLVSYLRQKLDEGERFFRSKRIAKDIDLSAKQVGVYLAKHDGEGGVDVEKRARARSTTWEITFTDEQELTAD